MLKRVVTVIDRFSRVALFKDVSNLFSEALS
jgi:hypothetical protein